jgi:hypothetical protein
MGTVLGFDGIIIIIITWRDTVFSCSLLSSPSAFHLFEMRCSYSWKPKCRLVAGICGLTSCDAIENASPSCSCNPDRMHDTVTLC